MLKISLKLILLIIHVTRHFIQYHIHQRLGLIELGIGLGIHASRHFLHYHIHLRLVG